MNPDGDGAASHEAAPAKVNLYLHVTGRRADGYHSLSSLVAFAGVGDRLAVRSIARGLTLETSGPFAAAVPGDAAANLVVRAARQMLAAAGRTDGLALTLVKTLPVAAGLGGGSADAAATMRAIERHLGLSLAESRRRAIALALGADVPACLASVPVLMGGIGDRLAPYRALPPVGIVLVNPNLPLSTAAVFQALDGRFSPDDPMPAMALDFNHLTAALAARRNDLEAPARQLCPALDAVLAALGGQPEVALARMSGSGVTCFGLTRDAATAAAVARRLAAARADWWVAASTLSGGCA